MYALLLLVDATNMVKNSNFLIVAYCGLVLIISIKYCSFLESMIVQLTRYLGIRLLKVKEVTRNREDKTK